MPIQSSEVTQLLDRWGEGEAGALDGLMPLIVEDLRHIARNHLVAESVGHTLQPTALVNEVYLRLAGRRTVQWRNRQQFFAFVAGLMRRILVDHARKRQTVKRGSGALKIAFDETVRLPNPGKDPDLLALDDSLGSLAAVDPRQCRIVEMRYFTGLSIQEVAVVEGISPTTVKREWRTAKLWLYQHLSRS
jgi:RNA polymerase sigma factor (TIGR02999 family)